MMKKERNLRLLVSGILLLAIVAAGVGLYQAGDGKGAEEQNRQEELAKEEGDSDTPSEYEDSLQSEDVNTSNAQAQMEEEAEESETNENDTAEEEMQETVTENVEEILPALDFSENTVMQWPVQGDVLIDYSMDGAVYFPTLEEYKYNPAVILSAAESQAVQAAANSKVVSVTENEETGVTVTMDMGNGYQAVYGQLQDVSVEPEQTVAAGTVIGTVAAPTKYYSEEGTNLYFAMTKDGESVDPVMYLDTGEE
ncbi:MAG: peptidoglycan DD-metalloendopeptidase family protein [Ruminococcus sp.]|jgi:septal ring factor EnvC (AmiA/AmiB activator)